jgi:sodium-dependent dicarboxylate transporter 2/3/5
MLDWNRASKKVMWELLFLYAGGLALGAMVTESGSTDSIAKLIGILELKDGYVMILIFVTFTVLLAEISSNTAAAAISVPIVVSITKGMGLNPIPYIYITAAAFNCAYVLPTSIRSIPVGYGLNPKFMFKNGLVLTILGILIISTYGFIAIRFIPGF